MARNIVFRTALFSSIIVVVLLLITRRIHNQGIVEGPSSTFPKVFLNGTLGASRNSSVRGPVSTASGGYIHFNKTSPVPAPTSMSLLQPLSNSMMITKCFNQTQCIQPVLQLKHHFNVYYCKHMSFGVRFFYLVREGLLLHPKIHLVETPEAADVIVYLPESARWHKSECSNPQFRNKTLVLDEGDGQQLFEIDDETSKTQKFLLMFKRSYVRRNNGQFKGYMPYVTRMDVLPMTYTIADAYVKTVLNTMEQRDIEILCTLRGSNADPARLRVREWVGEYAKARGVTRFGAGQINSDSRTVISAAYFDRMHRSQIIVTVNPSGWEGDFRLCEALASGALIFVDHMFVPRQDPLLQGVHLVYYDNSNKTDLFDKLDRYRKDRDLARRVAVQGYLHAMKHHRAANLIDYVFRTLQAQTMAQQDGKLDLLDGTAKGIQGEFYGYSQTGFHLRHQALLDMRRQKKAQKPDAPKAKLK